MEPYFKRKNLNSHKFVLINKYKNHRSNHYFTAFGFLKLNMLRQVNLKVQEATDTNTITKF